MTRIFIEAIPTDQLEMANQEVQIARATLNAVQNSKVYLKEGIALDELIRVKAFQLANVITERGNPDLEKIVPWVQKRIKYLEARNE